MKKHLNKIFSCLVALVLFVGFGFILTGCADGSNPEAKTTKVVNISLNPSVEFVLDKNDNVLTFNATNDEGNFILVNANFEVGESINSAVEKFLTVAKENGFIVSGENEKSENKLKIEVSGNSAVALYNQIKTKAKNYLDQFNIDFTSSFERITKGDLQTLVIDSCREVVALRMSEEQLIEQIKKSRQETSRIYSQELKNLFYEIRYQEILKTQFQSIVNEFIQVENLPNLDFLELVFNLGSYEGENVYEKFATYLNEQISVFETKAEDLNNLYENLMLNNEDYLNAFNSYIEAKQTLLEARLNGEVDDVEMDNLEKAVSDASIYFYGDKDGLNADGTDSILTQAKLLVENKVKELDTFKTALDFAIQQITSYINNENVNTAVEEVKNNFATSFKNGEFKLFVDNSSSFWNNLKPNID